MAKFTNLLVILVVLAITGKIRMPFEQKLAEDLHAHKLVPPRLTLKERSRLKQKAFVATYGSLRPTIAAFMSSATVSLQSNQEWDKIEHTFEEILLLDPYNYYYWDTASWHMVSNAAKDKQNDQSLTEVAKQKVFKEYIQKGKDIIDQGIAVNPDNWKFLELKAKVLSDRFRNPDYAQAIEVNKQLLKMPNLPPHIERITHIKILYQMIQLPERYQEAYDLSLELFQKGSQYHSPIVLNQILISQNHPLIKVESPMSLIEIYGSAEEALDTMKFKLRGNHKGQKLYGLKENLRTLEEQFDVPIEERLSLPENPLFLK